MDAIELLTTRCSNGKLHEPAPSDDALQVVLAAAARAPDHGALRPVRVRIIRGAARDELGALFASWLRRSEPSATDEQLSALRHKALRAPIILAVGAHIEPHPKVPAVEQVLAAGAAAHAMLLALHALGYGAIWRTGAAVYDEQVKRALGFRAQDALVGLLYAGTPKQPPATLARPRPEDFAREWCGAED